MGLLGERVEKSFLQPSIVLMVIDEALSYGAFLGIMSILRGKQFGSRSQPN